MHLWYLETFMEIAHRMPYVTFNPAYIPWIFGDYFLDLLKLWCTCAVSVLWRQASAPRRIIRSLQAAARAVT